MRRDANNYAQLAINTNNGANPRAFIRSQNNSHPWREIFTERTSIRPVTNNTIDIGTTALRYRDIFVQRHINFPTGNYIYEEGIWTPTLFVVNTAHLGTFASRNGSFVRNGRFVWIAYRMFLTMNNTTILGALSIRNLPFISRAALSGSAPIVEGYISLNGAHIGNHIPFTSLPANSSNLNINSMAHSLSGEQQSFTVTASLLRNNTTISGSMSYWI